MRFDWEPRQVPEGLKQIHRNQRRHQQDQALREYIHEIKRAESHSTWIDTSRAKSEQVKRMMGDCGGVDSHLGVHDPHLRPRPPAVVDELRREEQEKKESREAEKAAAAHRREALLQQAAATRAAKEEERMARMRQLENEALMRNVPEFKEKMRRDQCKQLTAEWQRQQEQQRQLQEMEGRQGGPTKVESFFPFGVDAKQGGRGVYKREQNDLCPREEDHDSTNANHRQEQQQQPSLSFAELMEKCNSYGTNNHTKNGKEFYSSAKRLDMWRNADQQRLATVERQTDAEIVCNDQKITEREGKLDKEKKERVRREFDAQYEACEGSKEVDRERERHETERLRMAQAMEEIKREAEDAEKSMHRSQQLDSVVQVNQQRMHEKKKRDCCGTDNNSKETTWMEATRRLHADNILSDDTRLQRERQRSALDAQIAVKELKRNIERLQRVVQEKEAKNQQEQHERVMLSQLL